MVLTVALTLICSRFFPLSYRPPQPGLRQTLFISHLNYYNSLFTDTHASSSPILMFILYFAVERTFWNINISVSFSLVIFSGFLSLRIISKTSNTFKFFTSSKKYISDVFLCPSYHSMHLTCLSSGNLIYLDYHAHSYFYTFTICTLIWTTLSFLFFNYLA